MLHASNVSNVLNVSHVLNISHVLNVLNISHFHMFHTIQLEQVISLLGCVSNVLGRLPIAVSK